MLVSVLQILCPNNGQQNYSPDDCLHLPHRGASGRSHGSLSQSSNLGILVSNACGCRASSVRDAFSWMPSIGFLDRIRVSRKFSYILFHKEQSLFSMWNQSCVVVCVSSLPLDACCILHIALGTWILFMPSLAPDVTCVRGEWEVNTGEGQWTKLPADVMQQLSVASASGQKNCTVTMKGNVYMMDLENMQQKNTSSGVKRKLRSTLPSSSARPTSKSPPRSPGSSQGGRPLHHNASGGLRWEVQVCYPQQF